MPDITRGSPMDILVVRKAIADLIVIELHWEDTITKAENPRLQWRERGWLLNSGRDFIWESLLNSNMRLSEATYRTHSWVSESLRQEELWMVQREDQLEDLWAHCNFAKERLDKLCHLFRQLESEMEDQRLRELIDGLVICFR
ncbi:hypothetical protein SBOR_9961 [Sclerotinia borealis F-4128]|uniref:Uncharacterized protein n=1 Tax=Sclerotinia borealis (strain F-4128) TaxID=1432307 RepID=W9BYI6_SCLBF|nr:hypothetical protein SBOR_9961 [Sclerotinia borealis F-4128]